jgi:hypothetical protein
LFPANKARAASFLLLDELSVDHRRLPWPGRDSHGTNLGLDECISRDDLSAVIILVRWILYNVLDLGALGRGTIRHVDVFIEIELHFLVAATNALVLHRPFSHPRLDGIAPLFTLVSLLVRAFSTAACFLLNGFVCSWHVYHSK